MADLISREKAIAEAERIIGERAGFKAYAIVDMLRKLDAVDAVEVIRCKDCQEHGYSAGIPYCMNIDNGLEWKDVIAVKECVRRKNERLNQQTGGD